MSNTSSPPHSPNIQPNAYITDTSPNNSTHGGSDTLFSDENDNFNQDVNEVENDANDDLDVAFDQGDDETDTRQASEQGNVEETAAGVDANSGFDEDPFGESSDDFEATEHQPAEESYEQPVNATVADTGFDEDPFGADDDFFEAPQQQDTTPQQEETSQQLPVLATNEDAFEEDPFGGEIQEAFEANEPPQMSQRQSTTEAVENDRFDEDPFGADDDFLESPQQQDEALQETSQQLPVLATTEEAFEDPFEEKSDTFESSSQQQEESALDAQQETTDEFAADDWSQGEEDTPAPVTSSPPHEELHQNSTPEEETQNDFIPTTTQSASTLSSPEHEEQISETPQMQDDNGFENDDWEDEENEENAASFNEQQDPVLAADSPVDQEARGDATESVVDEETKAISSTQPDEFDQDDDFAANDDWGDENENNSTPSAQHAPTSSTKAPESPAPEDFAPPTLQPTATEDEWAGNFEESHVAQSTQNPPKSSSDFASDDDFENAEFHSGDDIEDFSDFEESEFEEAESATEASSPTMDTTHPYSSVVNAILQFNQSSQHIAQLADSLFQSIIPPPHPTSTQTPITTTSITDISLETLFDKNFSQLSRKFSDIANWSNSSIEEIFLRHIGFVKQQKKRRKHKRLHPAAAHTRTFSGLSSVDGASVLSGLTPSTPASNSSLHTRHRSFAGSTPFSPEGVVTEEFSEHELEEFNNILEKSKNARRPSVLSLVGDNRRRSISSLAASTPNEDGDNSGNMGSNNLVQTARESPGFDDNFESDDDFDAADDFEGATPQEQELDQFEAPTPKHVEITSSGIRERSSSVTRGKTTVTVETSELNMDGLTVRERSPSNPSPPVGLTTSTMMTETQRSFSAVKSTPSAPQRNRFDDDEFDADFDDNEDFEGASFEDHSAKVAGLEVSETVVTVQAQEQTLSLPSFDDFDDFLGGGAFSAQQSQSNPSHTTQLPEIMEIKTTVAPSSSMLMEFDDFMGLGTAGASSNQVHDSTTSLSSTRGTNEVASLLDMIPDLDFMQSKDFIKTGINQKEGGQQNNASNNSTAENILDFF